MSTAPKEPHQLQFPGSERDLVFWHAVALALMRRLGHNTVCLRIEELVGHVSLGVYAACIQDETRAIILDTINPQTSTLEAMPMASNRVN